MNILWITPELPYPPNTGGNIGIYKRIVEFSKNNEIHLVSIISNENSKKYEDDLLKICKTVKMYNRKKSKLSTALFLLKYPYIVASRSNVKMKKHIKCINNKHKIDVVMVDGPQMMNVIVNSGTNGKIIINQHNIEYLALRSIAKVCGGLKKRIYTFESIRMKAFELNVCKNEKIDLITFVSSKDKEHYEKITRLTNTLLVPVGADNHVKFNNNLNGNNHVMFIANMTYQPNIDGVKWFIHEVWEKVVERISDAKFYIVGKDPSLEIRSMQCDNIIVTGTIDDVDEYYKKASIVVLPLKSGGGVKVKLIEAMSYAKLIITTKKGIEGTLVKNNREIILADEAEEFASKCIDALVNKEKYREIANNAYQMVKKNYTWDVICSKFENEIKKIL